MVPLITLRPDGANTIQPGARLANAQTTYTKAKHSNMIANPTKYTLAPIGSTGDDFGSLHNLATGEFIRRATEAEADASGAAGDTGAILVNGLICYVQP
jgi:hypothetical protein